MNINSAVPLWEVSPITGVWEITMGCNMRCKHCGSSCENAFPDELTTEEAVELCKAIGKLGFKWITLSGGEPTTRKDWDVIAKALRDNGVIPNMITNGWLINDEIAQRIVEAGINTVAISIDGLEKTHDFIRKDGSYQRIMKAFEVLKSKGIFYSAITTVNRYNINELPQLKDILIEKGVYGWQLQIGLPMGNMSVNNNLIMEPCHVDQIIHFAYETMKEKKIDMQLADCIGYYNKKEIEVRKCSLQVDEYHWQGCPAGKYGMGILCNGDIIGCTSVRDKEFIEGNVRQTPLEEIWRNPESFSWNRTLTKDNLQGFCSKCQFGATCLGGCSNTRITMGGSVYAENRYCSYHLALSKAKDELSKYDSFDTLFEKAKKYVSNHNYQLSELALSMALEKNTEHVEALNLFGYVSFMLGNYINSKMTNEKVLKINSKDPYAHKGLGLCMHRLGETEKGIKLLKKAIELSSPGFLDPYYDLAIVYAESGRIPEALEVLKEGRSKSPDFISMSQGLYEQLSAS